MTASSLTALELPHGAVPDPDEFVQAAMAWHFNPATGSPFWLRRAETLDFNPRADIRSFADLRLFPNVTDELRTVPVEDLIPRGFGPRPDVVKVIESGGTTGPPKRLPLLREFADRLAAADVARFEQAGVTHTKNWLALFPSGPHGAFEQMNLVAKAYGVLQFGVDIDPRWVKKQAAAGNAAAVEEYTEHIIDQAAFVLADQNIGLLRLTGPVLARMVRRDDLVELIRAKVDYIGWGGAQMDLDTRYFYRTELFSGITFSGDYGTTMALGAGGRERPALGPDDPCIYDPTLSPYVTFSVIDAGTGAVVPYGERGQVVVNHLSKSFLLPNNAERDVATRIEALPGQVGDSIADVSPLADFGGAEVIEGVY